MGRVGSMTNPVMVQHKDVCLRMMSERRAMEGRLAGKAPCEVCWKRPATQGHHLIFNKASITGASEGIRILAEHEFNLLLVCHKCHHALHNINPLERDWLIWREVYHRHGYQTVAGWVKLYNAKLGISMAIPRSNDVTFIGRYRRELLEEPWKSYYPVSWAKIGPEERVFEKGWHLQRPEQVS